MDKKKLLVSSCLLGENVKYNGKNNLMAKDDIIKLQDSFELVSFCPEVAGGLPIPRIPCEICSYDPIKVINKNQEDKTRNFTQGASLALELCKQKNIKIAILKSNSPSCSNEYVYDGSFSGNKIKHDGVTTKLLKTNNITVINENQIDKLYFKI